MNNRIKILNNLLEFSKPLDELKNNVSNLVWDYEGPTVIATRLHIKAVLTRFLKGELTKREVEDWANLIECREDLDFDPDCSDELSEIIYQLANPELEGELSYKKCIEIIDLISS
ncbi:MAG: hypothetical protein GY874_05335 [Desulfobacteraceae bacterium]|nr:hypothetical protein [Desulfobacteraceae bacterium]